MIRFVEQVGSNFDFMRIDLFLLKGRIYLREMGLVPNGCSIPIRSPELDHLLGAMWDTPWMGKSVSAWPDLYEMSLARKLFDDLPKDQQLTTDYRPPWVSQ